MSCMIELFIAFGREISKIRAANRVYWARSAHNNLEQELHERRRERLQEIRKNFLLWFGIHISEQGGEGWETGSRTRSLH